MSTKTRFEKEAKGNSEMVSVFTFQKEKAICHSFMTLNGASDLSAA